MTKIWLVEIALGWHFSDMFSPRIAKFLLTLLVPLLAFGPVAHATGTSAANRIVLPINAKKSGKFVSVPRGISQLVIEKSNGGTWTAWKVIPVQFGPKEVRKNITLKLPAGLAVSRVRAIGYTNSNVPSQVGQGQTSFEREEIINGYYPVMIGGGYITMANSGVVNSSISTTSVVVESDIWKIVGKTLFFFNQYRGLQVIDLTNPVAPVLTGTLRLPANGEEFFTLNEDGSLLALLGRSRESRSSDQSLIYIIKITDGVPALLTKVPVNGYVNDSRLIGDKLYLLTSGSRPPSSGALIVNGGETVVQLQTIDLANAALPVTQPAISCGQGTGVLQAAGNHLLVAMSSWYSNTVSSVRLFDLNESGNPTLNKVVSLKGYVQDKFKMSIVNDALVAVTAVNRFWSNRSTWVETFPISGSQTAPLAQFEIVGARNETLHATRFDGDRLYVVTFRNTDPLFVIDLSDPANPVQKAELVIPGWSSYIQPLGNRLLSVGVEAGRVAVSLFDVSNPTAPALLSRVYLGAEGTNSWSEANYDEKAVEFFPDAGVALVPYNSWTPTGPKRVMQAILVGDTALTLDAAIKHQFDARRGGVFGDYFVSISGKELIVVGRSNQTETPDVQVSLAWRVDRVIPAGDYLLQLDEGPGNYAYSWNRLYYVGNIARNATLRITPAADPDRLIEEIDLGAGHVFGTLVQGQRCFLAQQVPATVTTPALIRTWEFDLTTLPNLADPKSVDHPLPNAGNYNLSQAQVFTLGAGKFAWFLPKKTSGYSFGYMPLLPVLYETSNGGTEASVAASVAMLLPVEFGETLTASASVPVGTNRAVRDVSKAQLTNGFLFFSYDTSESLPATPTPGGGAVEVVSGGTLTLSSGMATNLHYYYPSVGTKRRSWLQVVDLTSAVPVVNEAVSLPGIFLGAADVTANGAFILSRREAPDNGSRQIVEVSNYNGKAARLIDSLYIASSISEAFAEVNGRFYFVSSDYVNPGLIGVDYNAATHGLRKLGTWETGETAASPNYLIALNGYLISGSYLAVQAFPIRSSGLLDAPKVTGTPTDISLRLDRSAASADGFWIPAGDYGVEFVSWSDLE